jgi:DNA-binding NarL/FixJ family response regulator
MTRYFAILDDSTDAKETVVRVLPSALPAGWGLLECPLLASPADYPDWLVQNNVGVLLVDQRLNEEVPAGTEPVTYKGSDVLQTVRRAMPGFPLVVLTAYSNDEDLVASKGKADYVLGRPAFLIEMKDHVERLVRHATDFLATFEVQLAEFTALAQKKAQGQTTAADQVRLGALQGLFDWPAGRSPKDEAFDQLEERLRLLEALKQKAEPLLMARKKKK